MKTLPAVFLVALVTTAAVGLLDRQGWPSFLIGAVLALCLWVMLFFGSFAGEPKHHVAAVPYAGASLLGVVIGASIVGLTGTSAFWAVGFIMAGAIVPASTAALRDRSST